MSQYLILPPLVDTPMTENVQTDDKMDSEKVASLIISRIENKKEEVYPGIAKITNFMSEIAFKKISKIVNKDN